MMDFILWRLPYATGLGLIHAAAIRKGVAMELVNGVEPEEKDGGMLEAFENVRRRYAEASDAKRSDR